MPLLLWYGAVQRPAIKNENSSSVFRLLVKKSRLKHNN